MTAPTTGKTLISTAILNARVVAADIPGLMEQAAQQARDLWGDAADLDVETPGEIATSAQGGFTTIVTVHRLAAPPLRP